MASAQTSDLEYSSEEQSLNQDTSRSQANRTVVLPENHRFPRKESLTQRFRYKLHSCCSVKSLKRRLPITVWLPRYNLASLWMDLLAGFTVALTAIPQSIAYGAVAGLPIEYGLYTAFAGPIVYTVFGSVKQITMGPTAVMALMTQHYTAKGGAPYAILLSFLAGCFEFIAGILNLGFLVDFISGPVISGFCSAAAATVIFSQIKSMLGLKFPGSSFLKVIPGVINNWNDIKLWDAVLGASFLIFLILLKNLNQVKKLLRCSRNKYLDETLWFITTCRNALAVILGCILAYALECYGLNPFSLTGAIVSGVPPFRLPPFSFHRPVEPYVTYNSTSNWTDILTNNQTVSFGEALSDLGAGLALVPIIAILEQVAIAKAFASGTKTDSSQEMIALGLGSIFCSFFGSMPLTASFTRSSVLSSTGNKTPFASFFNGTVMLLALGFLMPTFSYIPKSVLGAVIVTSVFPMIEFSEILPLWRGRRVELIPFITTFLSCLFLNMEYGILIGAQIHLLLLAYEASRPKTSTVLNPDADGGQLIVRPDRNFYFPSTEVIRNALNKAARQTGQDANRSIVIDLANVQLIDHTALKMLKSVLLEWSKKHENFYLVNVDEDLQRTLRAVLPAEMILLGPRTSLSSNTTKISLDEGRDSPRI